MIVLYTDTCVLQVWKEILHTKNTRLFWYC